MIISADPTTNQTSEQLPTYNAYSVDGAVTAPLVYVNYGGRDDYEQLERMGFPSKAQSLSLATEKLGVAPRPKSRRSAERSAASFTQIRRMTASSALWEKVGDGWS